MSNLLLDDNQEEKKKGLSSEEQKAKYREKQKSIKLKTYEPSLLEKVKAEIL